MERSLTKAWRWEDSLKIMLLSFDLPKNGEVTPHPLQIFFWWQTVLKWMPSASSSPSSSSPLPSPHVAAMISNSWTAVQVRTHKKHWLSFLGTWSTRVLRPSRVRAWVPRWSLPCYRYWLFGIPHSWYQSVQSYDEDCKNGFLGWVMS